MFHLYSKPQKIVWRKNNFSYHPIQVLFLHTCVFNILDKIHLYFQLFLCQPWKDNEISHQSLINAIYFIILIIRKKKFPLERLYKFLLFTSDITILPCNRLKPHIIMNLDNNADIFIQIFCLTWDHNKSIIHC